MASSTIRDAEIGTPMDRLREHIELMIRAEKTQEEIARYIASNPEVSEDERVLARMVLHHAGLRSVGVTRYLEEASRIHD